jgi:hypothetical protein
MNDRKDVGAESAFIESAKGCFDESVSGLDAETQSRLNRGRQVALAELGRAKPVWVRWAPATGVAAAAVVAVVMWTGYPVPEEAVVPAVGADMEILLTEDSLEMLEDLEFYSWIEFEEDTDSPGEPQNNVG